MAHNSHIDLSGRAYGKWLPLPWAKEANLWNYSRRDDVMHCRIWSLLWGDSFDRTLLSSGNAGRARSLDLRRHRSARLDLWIRYVLGVTLSKWTA